MARTDKTKVLVTGSSGFVGRHLVRRLSAAGFECVEFDILNSDDILNVSYLMAEPAADIVIHLAAKTGVSNAFETPYELYHDNYLATLNILEYCRVKNAKKIVLSSSYLYGEPRYLPVDEVHPLSIKNPYGRSKLFSEQLCAAYCEDYGIQGVSLRNFNIYGVGQSDEFLIPTIARQIVSNSEVIKVRDLEPKRDFVYVEDVVNAFLKCVDKSFDRFEVFNIGSGEAYSVLEIIEIMFKITGSHKDISASNEIRKNEITDIVADNSKALKRLGWEPRYSIEEGLKKVLESMKIKNV